MLKNAREIEEDGAAGQLVHLPDDPIADSSGHDGLNVFRVGVM
jgi:hypothetical protein